MLIRLWEKNSLLGWKIIGCCIPVGRQELTGYWWGTTYLTYTYTQVNLKLGFNPVVTTKTKLPTECVGVAPGLSFYLSIYHLQSQRVAQVPTACDNPSHTSSSHGQRVQVKHGMTHEIPCVILLRLLSCKSVFHLHTLKLSCKVRQVQQEPPYGDRNCAGVCWVCVN